MEVSAESVRSGTRLLLGVALVCGCEVPTAPPRIESTWRFPTESIELPVSGVATSSTSLQDLSDIDIADDIRSAVIRVTPSNPSNASGVVTFEVSRGGVTVRGSVNVRGGANQAIPLTQPEIRALLGGTVEFRASGTLCPPAGCGPVPPPFAMVTLETELEVVVEVGGEG
jgi:hypothetical protein